MSGYTPTTAEMRERFVDPDEMRAEVVYQQESEFDRWLASVRAGAWEEGARWAAVEFSGDDRYERGASFMVPGENPYEEAQ